MKKVLILTCLTCILLGFAIAFTTSIASAQAAAPKKPMATSGADKSMATKEGMDALATKEYDKDKLPNKKKIFFGVGSIILAIVVVKWL